MNKKTAVDELIYKIHQELDWFYPKVRLSQKLVDEMKQLEKQQIIQAVDHCLASVKLSDDKKIFTATTAEQYYHQTYNNE